MSTGDTLGIHTGDTLENELDKVTGQFHGWPITNVKIRDAI